MSVWLCIPSARPIPKVNVLLHKWRAQGYKIAICRDQLASPDSALKATDIDADMLLIAGFQWGTYPGYAVAVNELIRRVALTDPDANWFVTGGDDTEPDPNADANTIDMQCRVHFIRVWSFRPDRPECGAIAQATFGVMQPTGDRWGDRNGAYIDRVAGSPWIGRKFALEMYGGRGPYWPQYTHMGVDEELQQVALKYGVLWQRPDLTHYHDHWGRPRPGEAMGHAANMPAFLSKANSSEEWDRYKRLFATRAAAGFPGSEPVR